MKTKFALIITLGFVLFNFTHCSDDEQVAGPDLELYNEATATTGFTYYQDNPIIRASSGASGHLGYMRVRFNTIAQSVLGLDGRLPVGSSFPNGSLIVKELYDNASGSIQLYAVMKKDSLNEYAGAN